MFTTVCSTAVAAAALIATVVYYKSSKDTKSNDKENSKDKKNSKFLTVKNFEVGKVYLHQYNALPGLPNASPFCMKLEGYLKFRKIPYELGAPTFNAPKGQFPFIELDGEAMGDSGLIIDMLEAKHGFSDDLSNEQKALAIAISRILEGSLYWQILHYRWNLDAGWKGVAKHFFDDQALCPNFMKPLLKWQVRGHVSKQTYYQSISRHSLEEVLSFSEKDIFAISTLLGGKEFMLGDQMSIIDCSVYAFLANALYEGIETPLRGIVCKYDNLLSYCERVKSQIWNE